MALLCLNFPIAWWIECLPGVWDIMAGNLIGTQEFSWNPPCDMTIFTSFWSLKIVECGDKKLLYIVWKNVDFWKHPSIV